mmetsp:Transcript_32556/g.79919  ORF Transcript_32556/g.79919 Transcript_32556/m.79919 type:complete len:106 (+) Transcript_32556:932-1249(+)
MVEQLREEGRLVREEIEVLRAAKGTLHELAQQRLRDDEDAVERERERVRVLRLEVERGLEELEREKAAMAECRSCLEMGLRVIEDASMEIQDDESEEGLLGDLHE